MADMGRSPAVTLRERLFMPVTVVVLVTLAGTLGYYGLGREQQATLLDALFMTVITITTIGYGEVIRLDEAGRLFTIVIALTGIGSLFYSLTVTMDHLVMMRISDPMGIKRMKKEINSIEGHVIIAGLGRVGRQAAKELSSAGTPFVVIDPQPEVQRLAQDEGYLMLVGDASDDGVLESAQIDKARGLIVTTGDDASNVYIVLSARVLNPGLFIISRAVEEASIPKLMRAGADRAMSPYAIGGRRLAHLILSPAVIDFFDSVISRDELSLSLEGVQVVEGGPAVGRCLADLALGDRTGAHVLVILRGTEVLANPSDAMILESGDRLLALGTSEQLKRLEEVIQVSAGRAGLGGSQGTIEGSGRI